MTQNSEFSRFSSNTAARIVMILSAAFLAILFLLHFLEPEFDPSWRMISEYEIGSVGWMMTLAFFCWGGSALALVLVLWPSLKTVGGKIGRVWLALIGIVLFGAGIFTTNAITDPTPSTSNSLHTLCGAFVILTFPIVASLLSGSLVRNPAWAGLRPWLTWGTLLVWLGVIAYFGAIIVSNMINPAAGRVGPQVYLGWPNRFMVVIYNVWLIVLARYALLKVK